jgi:hypothetical protein
MSISLELIEKLKKKVNISYADAKEALEKCNGDLVDALIYLEKEDKIKADPQEKKSSGFLNTVKEWIKRGNDTRLVISKNDETVVNISLTIFIILAIIATPVVIIALLLLLFTGHKFRMKITGCDETQINRTFDDISAAAVKVTDKVTEIINK